MPGEGWLQTADRIPETARVEIPGRARGGRTFVITATTLTVTLPDSSDIAELDQHEEYCNVVVDGEARRIRFHDYAEIFKIPGLYEELFATLLECRSPEVIAGLLGAALDAAGEKPSSLRVLDFGAGNGMVAEELVRLGVDFVVGADLLPEAREAALRDRPDVYRDYIAADVTALSDEQRAVLRDADLNALTCVAALGFADIPPVAFASAYNAIDEQGWIAFNLRDRYMDSPSPFARLLSRMADEGLLTDVTKQRYRHRLNVAGEPLDYIAFVARKQGHIPADWI